MRKSLFFILALALSVILGYVFTIDNSKNLDNKNVSDLPGDIVDPIKEQIKTMSIEDKVGQLVMVGVDGYENDENSQKLIKEYHVGGIVLLQKKCSKC